MRLLKLALPAAILIAILFTGGTTDSSWTEAQASTPITDKAPARDAATSAEDIQLTNSCIEDGMEKIYCLCVTKIFKNEMSLRQYRAAATLYKPTESAAITLIDKGYSKAEINAVKDLQKELSSKTMFRTRCDIAETYFAAAIEG